MDPIRLGIIGCGVIGSHHVTSAATSPVAELVAVADAIEERARAAATKFNVPSYYNNADDLLNDERVEAVALAMPAGVRTPIAFKALEKGKHVILEKPAASHASEIEKMIALRGDRVVACCSPRNAFSGHAEAAAKCVASGALGKIRIVRVRAILATPPNPSENPPPWRQSMKQNGGGILANWSCYDLDYLMQITGWQLRPRVVLAKWWPVAEKMSAYVATGSDADSHYIAFILCEDDIVLSMERAEFSSATTDQVWEIIGTEGTLHLPMQPQKGKPNAVILDQFVPGEGVVSKALWEEGQGGGPSGGILEDFVHAIREHRQPKTNLERALVMQKITDAIYASTRSGGAVSIT
ncbi:Gfo/Idh/MocA family oxidoreductase [Candidatus Poribacteria bacterium]|nr:Gfo/Idh/MocA family oxidoreductase [Candidatus Poribacteria bacterium]